MHALLDLVFPTACAGCDVAGVVVCARCAAELLVPARPARPRPAPEGLPPAFAVADYAGTARPLLLAYKEHGVVGLQHLLGTALAAATRAALAAHPAAAVAVVPVPSSAAARRARGDDIVARLARRVVRLLAREQPGLRCVPALRHVRRVADSAGLGAAARAANLSEAFGVRRGAARALGGRPVVLLDDLMTTGATLSECAVALRRCGIAVVGAATVAATRLDTTRPPGPDAGEGLHNRRRGHYGRW